MRNRRPLQRMMIIIVAQHKSENVSEASCFGPVIISDGTMNELHRIREIYDTQPFLHWIGIEIIDAGPGWVHERLPIRPEFFQPDVVHGGVIYSLADTVAAHAVLTMIYPKEWATTVEQKINFLRPATSGAILATARVVQLGNRIGYCEAEVATEAGKLVAKSTATIMRIPRE